MPSLSEVRAYKPPLEGVVQYLQTNPRNYLCFGAYWWWVKAWLKGVYNSKTLYFLGKADDPAARLDLAIHWKYNPEDIWKAAINHMQTQVASNQTEGVSTLPRRNDHVAYQLHDPDVF